MTRLNNNNFESFSSIDFIFKDYIGSVTSDFDEKCNHFRIIFELNPNNLPVRHPIEKYVFNTNLLIPFDEFKNPLKRK